MTRLFRTLAALAGTVLSATVLALPVPYTTILPDPVVGAKLGWTFDFNKKRPEFVYGTTAPLYSFTVPGDPQLWTGDLTKEKDIEPLPAWARAVLADTVLPKWAQLPPMDPVPQVMAQGLAASTRKDITSDEVAAHDAVYLKAQGARPVYWPQDPQTPGAPAGAHVVFAFADFGADFVQNLLDSFDWPDKPLDANGRLPSWSERTRGLTFDKDGHIDGAVGGAEIAIDGTLGVWIPAQTWVQGQRVFGPHDFSMDLVLFNSKVAWNPDPKLVAKNKIDFYSVALHETGHDLGLHHARVPEPSTSGLFLFALAALLGVRRVAAAGSARVEAG
jgi:hypothetical protein